MDTIFAEATPPGRGGVSVVRLSGPDSRAVLESLAGEVPVARRAYLRAVRDGDDLIDRALVMWFPKGQSFTGEEVAEFHLHGSPVIGNRLAAAFLSKGLRRAEAGEFSRRAFVNGRMDLAEAEGLADLLSAETEAQRQLAMRNAEGEVGRTVERLRAKLIRAGALVEASIDFADEEVPEDVPPEVLELIGSVRADIAAMLREFPATERLRQGYEVAIIGAPNAGKSSLLNNIAKREFAIVSDIAGTTRDVLELRTDLRGLPVTFLDTAGIRETQDPVESIGVERAVERAAKADLRVLLFDGEAPTPAADDDAIVVKSKSDIASGKGISISSKTGDGVSELLDMIHDRLRAKVPSSGLISHRRQAEALERADGALAVRPDLEPEFLAEALREAAHSLASMLGKVGAEDYLDEVFSSFCIGK